MSTAFMTITRPLPSSSNSSTASTSTNNNISHHIHSSPSINPSALSATAAASIPLQQLLASSYRQHYPTTSTSALTSTGRLSPPSFSSLTPLEASIIHALRQKQLEAMASDSTISNTAPIGMTGVASHSSRASSRTSSPLTLAHVPNKQQPEPVDDSLAIYSQSRPDNAPLSQEEKELLNRPISPLPLTASTNPEEPTANDVLLGRGGKTNMHSGNRIFRQAVHNRQELYRKVPKYDKIWIAQNVVSKINQAGGRFMRQEQGKWVEVPQKKAIEKASQALREKEREHRRANLQFQKAKTKVGPLKKRKNIGDSDNNTII